jgi:hypothetical protein
MDRRGMRWKPYNKELRGLYSSSGPTGYIFWGMLYKSQFSDPVGWCNRAIYHGPQALCPLPLCVMGLSSSTNPHNRRIHLSSRVSRTRRFSDLLRRFSSNRLTVDNTSTDQYTGSVCFCWRINMSGASSCVPNGADFVKRSSNILSLRYNSSVTF